jgi:hypothetical protein
MISKIFLFFTLILQLQSPLHVFTLSGQSNMQGFAEPPQEQTIRANIFVWDNGWKVATEPLQSQYAGPGLAFAKALQDLYGEDYAIGLVPCAVSGSTSEQWQRGQEIYQTCVSKTQAALATQSGVYLSGVLHAQGESNTYTQSSADGWCSNTVKFARDFRTDTGKLEVPFIYAQLGRDPALLTHPYWTYLQELQNCLNSPSTYPYIRMVKTSDLPNNAQHFADAETYSIFGRRFAAMYWANFHP